MAEDKESTEDRLVFLLKEKSALKQDVYKVVKEQFELLKEVLVEEISRLRTLVDDERVRLSIMNSNDYEIQVAIGSDVLIFHMHTNVFRFEDHHPIWKTSYLDTDKNLGYCGIINIYNFLFDSFHFNRLNDQGYLIGRMLVNKECHYIMEGKGELGYMYRDFVNNILDKEGMQAVVKRIFCHTIDFDIYTPPYDIVNEVTVYDMQNMLSNLKLRTGKRLGFKFEADTE
jgi:hypothetical protein